MLLHDMDASLRGPLPATFLDVFLSIAQDSSRSEHLVIEYGAEQWTYGDLDWISTGLAIDLQSRFGRKPTVGCVSENHPYMLAAMFATWKLGGIFAPFDCHAPRDMLRKVFENTEPTCVLVSERIGEAISVIQELQVPIFPYDPESTTLTSLLQRFVDLDPNHSFALPSASSNAIYVHTSSASGPHNLKCVPVSHAVLLKGSARRLGSWRQAWFSQTINQARLLGWAPWSHLMGIMGDLGAGTLLTGGCYIFALALPSQDPNLDLIDRLLHAVVRVQPDIFVGVPWVVGGFKERYLRFVAEDHEEAVLVRQALTSVKAFGCGGALVSTDAALWAQELGIRLSNDVGMTELGPLFHSPLNLSKSGDNLWGKPELLIEDASLKLLDEDGNETNDGELVISSSSICECYLKHDSSVFSKTQDGIITFKTGDIYERLEDGSFIWKGRKDDYIQMVSSETFDPRPIEGSLNLCPAIAHSCIVGNRFMREASDYVLAIIEPAQASLSPSDALKITRAIASVNKTLPPPLRVAWSRVIVLQKGQSIPFTRKRAVFRKKLEAIFGPLVARLEKSKLVEELQAIPGPPHEHLSYANAEDSKSDLSINSKTIYKADEKSLTEDAVMTLIVSIVADVLAIEEYLLRSNRATTFAEFGMDSNMAILIVKTLNKTFSLDFPANTCHTYIDLVSLCHAVQRELGLVDAPPPTESIQTPSFSTQAFRPEVEEVVIVGRALRLPGDIDTSDAFWKALVDRRQDIMTHVPEDRWDHASFYRPPDSAVAPRGGDITFEKAGFVNIADFDNSFFGISAPEAKYINPTTRLTLETAFEALENACIPVSNLRGTDLGVWVAVGSNDGYCQMLQRENGFECFTRFFGTGTAASAASGRLSYLLDVHGPSLTVDTACSSGLVAFDQAVKYLQSGDGESAIVASANTIIWPGSWAFLSAQKMTSVNSRCATFTNEADGYVPSEGAVAVVLKTKSAALRDNDNILAVVKSTDIKHGGRSQGLVAPNVNAQIKLQRTLMAKAGIQPAEVDFIETHGTGTALGDMIEIQGINEVFQHSHSDNPLILGAAKSCIGHTEITAGLVGLLKTIATFEHAAVPGLTHLTNDNVNPELDLGTVPLSIPINTVPLPPKPNGVPHIGLVLSNGFAGTIAGTLLSSPTSEGSASRPLVSMGDTSSRTTGPAIFVVSAKTERALEQYLQEYMAFCRKSDSEQLHSICYSTCVGREHYRYRFSVVVSTMEDLLISLETRLNRLTVPPRLPANGILFAFPGQGCHYQGMASSLAETFPAFKVAVLYASAAASKLCGLPIASFLLDSDVDSAPTINDTRASQICIFVYQYAMAIWLQTLGIVPSAVLGHSLGEIIATVVSGALSFDVALELIVTRSGILRANGDQPGGMAIVAAPSESIRSLIGRLGLNNKLVIAVYNGSSNHVVSGEKHALEIFLASLRSDGIRGTKLNVGEGFHSPSIHPKLPQLQTWLEGGQYFATSLQIPLFSTAYGTEIPAGARLKPHHWIQHAREPVRFSDSMEAVNESKSIGIILDMGPQPFIWTILQGLPSNKPVIAATTKRSGDQKVAFLRSIAALFEYGHTIDLSKLFPSSSNLKKVSIPTYPFQRQRFYPGVVPSRNDSSVASTKPTSKSTRTVEFPVDEAFYELLAHHQIEGRRVCPGAALADFFARTSSQSVKAITFHAPLLLESSNDIFTAEISDDNLISMHATDSPSRKLCTGRLAPTPPPHSLTRIKTDKSEPCHIQDHATVYASFSNPSMHFGPSFRNIQEVRSYTTHVDALITLQPCQNEGHNPMLDRTRKLDPCLHMFGAIVTREIPVVRAMAGSFLPTSLKDFTLHTAEIPDAFICRYRLPLDSSRNFQVISTAFEVLSIDGEVLVTCGRYSIAWIPAGVAIQNMEKVEVPMKVEVESSNMEDADGIWYEQAWVEESASSSDVSTSSDLDVPVVEKMVYISPEGAASRLSSAFSVFARPTSFLTLPTSAGTDIDSKWSDDIANLFTEGDIFLVLDVTSPLLNVPPTSLAFVAVHRHVLVLLQVLGRCKATVKNFIVLTELSMPTTSPSLASQAESETNFIKPGIASIVHGMIRVFRREAALDDAVWALDLPDLASLTNDELRTLAQVEMMSRLKRKTKHRTVAYRRGQDGLVRVVPTLHRIRRTASESAGLDGLKGVALLVGLGDVGSALAPALIERGCSKIVFVGRRAISDPELSKALENLNGKSNGLVSYLHADVCDIDALRRAITDIQADFGPIEVIVHTAAVIEDAIIQNVDSSAFDRVLNPKVVGAWNLSILSDELCPSLKAFTLLGSISVSFGNRGQVAYVAGNAYMESLAAHRRARSLPGMCLQLGAWESRAVRQLDMKERMVSEVDNERGVPLILQAMGLDLDVSQGVERPSPVQVIAKLNFDQILMNAAYALDPLFMGILPKGRGKGSDERKRMTDDEVTDCVIRLLGQVLELSSSERLEMQDSLTGIGVDSISLAQVRGKVFADLNVEIPMSFLADTFTIGNMIGYVIEKYKLL